MKRSMIGITIIITSLCFVPMLSAAESVDTVLAQARDYYQQADKLQGAWLSTEKLIKKAQQALQHGDQTKARQLAQQARHEAKLSLNQARDQAKNWREPAYIKR